MKYKFFFVLICIHIILTGCAAPASSTSPAATGESATTDPITSTIPTHAPLMTFDITPFATLTPTPSAQVPFAVPDFLDSSVAQNNFLLSSNDDPNCPLPCWQGLHVGESDRSDVQRMFEDAFGFDTAWDVFGYPGVVEEATLPNELNLPGMQAGGYSWVGRTVNGWGYYFDIFALVNDQTGVLQGMYFLYGTGIEQGSTPEGGSQIIPGTELYQPATVAQTIRSLGAPDALYFDASVGLEMLLVYENGIVSYSSTIEPRKELVVQGVTGAYREFCLAGPVVSRREFLIAPFDLDSPAELTVMYQSWVLDKIQRSGMVPLEDLGWVITKEEIVEAAMTQDNPCLLFGPIE